MQSSLTEGVVYLMMFTHSRTYSFLRTSLIHEPTLFFVHQDADCVGCSGKVGVCCVNCEVCCKPNAPCLALICCGPKIECDGFSILNVQIQVLSLVISAAVPCNKEVPVAISILGATIYPKCGYCITIGDATKKDVEDSQEIDR